MIIKLRLALGLVLLAPAMAHALGLGEMRLASGLNQPIAADIEIVGATSEELQQIRAGLPSREMFARYGVDRPPYLSGFSFTVAKDGSGRAIIKVRSSESVTEPFVTFLVEVTWPRGHLIREYTALLDPPVFANKEAPPQPLAAPQTGESTAPAAGAVVRPAPEPAISAPVSAPTTPATSSGEPASVAAGDYRVVAHDTLGSIARRSGATSRDDLNKLMIATFRANPAAFDGNINRLHKGALLHIPGSSDWAGLDSATARREVHQQMADWRQASAKPAGEEAHLRLVPPTEPTGKTAAGTGAAAAAASSAQDQQRAAAEASAAAEQKRLLELRNEAMAQAQQQAKPAAAATPPAATPPAAETKPAQPPAATPPAAENATPPAAATPPAPKPLPAKAPTPAAEPSFLDTLTDNWMYVGGGLAALALLALFVLSTLRRRRADRAFDRAMEPSIDSVEEHAAPRVQRNEPPPRDAMLVEESDDDSGEFVAPAARVAPKAEPIGTATTTQSIEDTMSSDTAINLEQADPLAEADFHMAYGLYDQAADIVKLAIGREPARRDLKMKLLEVYFVWGNRDAFLEVARELGRSRDAGAAGEWDKVVIMGRQIAPEDPLFAGAAAPSGAGGVDLDLDAGGNQGVDLELLGGETLAPMGHTTSDDNIDLDLGQALAGNDASADTGESPTLDPDRLDLMLDDGPQADRGGSTREMRPHADAPTVEQPALRSSDAPTVETPVLGQGRDGTIRDKLDSALRRGDRAVAPDATAELSLDDLGFEVEKLGSTSTSLEALAVTDHPADAPTMVAGLDDNTRALLQAAGRGPKADLEPTRESLRPAQDLEPTRESQRPKPAHSATATGLDLDLDELARALESDTVEQPRRDEMRFSTDVFQTAIRKSPNGLDLDVGAPLGDSREPTVTERINADELSLPELEPVTLSEVGTKLDLARAYMDMGDPDGARSILQEVLSEGSASQRQEAQRLIETLPG